jgi:hypothetical protein
MKLYKTLTLLSIATFLNMYCYSQYPNLQVSFPQVLPTSTYPGGTIQVSIQESNISSCCATLVPNVCSVHLSPNNVLTPGANGDVWIADISFPTIPANSTTIGSNLNVNIPCTFSPGTYYVFFSADGGQVINEGPNEGDNFIQYYPLTISSTIPAPSTAPSPISGSSTIGAGSISSITPTLTWGNGTNNNNINVSEYPYGAAYLLSTNSNCKSGSSFSLSSGILQAGKLYRWNLSSAFCCGSASSGSGGTNYFHVPPAISASGSTTFCQGGSVTLSTNAVNVPSGSGATRTYQWYLNGSPVGTTSQNYVATQSGTYTLAISYSGSTNVGGTLTTTSSNSISVSVQTCGYTVSGTITNSSNGSALNGVTVNATGLSSTSTNSSGNYSFNVSPGYSGTITPVYSGFTFSPANISVSNANSNISNQNFIGTGNSYTISGTITNSSNGSALNGVTVNATGLSSTSTNSSGNYSFNVSPGYSGTITPVYSGFTFSPANISVSNINSNSSNQNFIGTGISTPTYLDISNIRIYANNILLSSGSTYIVSGNVYAVPRTGCSTSSEVLHFTGNTIFVNQSSNTISASNGTVFCSGIGSHGTVNLFSGSYTLHAVNDVLNADIFDLANTLFKLANLDLEVNNMQVLCDGIVLNGDVAFPNALTYFATSARLNLNLTTLYLTTNGIDLAGGLSLSNLKLSRNLNLESLNIDFDSNSDEFTGTTRLKTPAFNINAIAAIRSGQLDEIGLGFANTYNAVPLFSTGLAIDSVGGGLQNISTPNLNLYLGARISPYFGFTIPSLANLRIETNYSLGTSFNAWGRFALFNHTVANTGFTVSPGVFELSGDIDIQNILKAHANLSVSKNTNDVKLMGIFNANISIPPLLPSWLNFLNSYYAGKTLASTNNYINNDYLAGTGKISLIAPRLFYKLTWTNGWTFNWGKDVNLLPIEAQSQIGPFRISSVNNIYSFEVNTISENLIVTGKGSGIMPELTLYMMNGDSISKSNFLTHIGVNYIEDSVNSISSIVMSNPVLGNYYISSMNADSIFVMTLNQEPSIFINQITNNTSSKTLDVSFSCFDPDDDALITFGLDKDKKEANGILLINGLYENGNSGNVNLNYANIKTGEYYLYAIVVDSIGHTVINYFDQPIAIISSNSPNIPLNLIVSSNSTSINIDFDKNNSSPLNYLVYYSSTPGTVNLNSNNFSLGDTSSAQIDFLNPGHFYEFGITSIDTNGNESPMSSIASTIFISTSINNFPQFAALSCGLKAYIGNTYSCTIMSNDADNDPITYSIIDGPANLTINNSGNINWIPTQSNIGFNNIYIKITDGNGGFDSLYYQILVLDSTNNSPIGAFDRSCYFDYASPAIIKIYDPELDTANQVNLQISSSSDNTGIITNGFRNGQEFLKKIFLSNSSSNDSTLHALPGDTIWFSYTSPESGKHLTNFAHFDFFAADFISLDTICANENLKVYNISKGNNLSYTWEFGDSTLASTSKNPSHLFPLVNGTGYDQYMVSLKISNPEGHIDSTSRLITVRQVLSATINVVGNTSFCFGDSVLLQVSGGLSYQWTLDENLIPNAINQSFYAKESGMYSCVLTSNMVCSILSDSISVVTHSLPLIDLGNDTIINSGNSLILNAGSGFASYLWSNGDTTQTIIIHSPDTFSVIITDQNNCSNIDSIIVNLGTEISNPTNNRDISIYPNPSNGKFVIEFNSQYSEVKMIEVFDILGQRVFHKLCGGDTSIMIEVDLYPGIYTISIKGKSVINRKIIIE